MKRRLLSMVMAFAMVLSLIPAVYAAGADGSDLIDLLPGNETAKEAFLKILDGGILGNEESIQEIKELIDQEYSRPHGTADYVPDKNSYYVSLGDSTVTGMSTGDPAYNNFGYKTKVPTCAPYQVAQALGLDVNTQYEQLALGGLRTTDLRYILDETFAQDEYAFTDVKNSIDIYAGGLEQMRKDYKAALLKADLITVGIGNNNFSSFFRVQSNGAIAELLSEELKGPLNGIFGPRIKAEISKFLDLGQRPRKMTWERYLGADGAEKLKEALAEVEARLIAEGIPETYPVDLAVLAGEFLEIEVPTALKLNIDVPVAELATYFLECGLYSYVTFVVDFKGACDKIHEIAPDAELLILSMYNPADNTVFTFDGMVLPYGELYGLMVKTLSLQLRDYAEATPKTTFVDIYDTESLADRELEDGRVYELTECVEIMNNNSGDFHATPAGHSYMKGQILAALVPEEDGLLGDADGSGEVDYVDAMLVLQYHTGVITNDALALAQCDVDGSGAVDYVDAMLILQYHTGVISKF